MRKPLMRMALVLLVAGAAMGLSSRPGFADCVPMRPCDPSGYDPVICYEGVFNNLCEAAMSCATGCYRAYPG